MEGKSYLVQLKIFRHSYSLGQMLAEKSLSKSENESSGKQIHWHNFTDSNIMFKESPFLYTTETAGQQTLLQFH